MVEATEDLTETIGKRPDVLLRLLATAGGTGRRQLVCEAEVTHFESDQRDALLPLLWDYILKNRDSNDRDEQAKTSGKPPSHNLPLIA